MTKPPTPGKPYSPGRPRSKKAKSQTPEYRKAALDRSIAKLIEAGGRRLQFRLSPEANKALIYMQEVHEETATAIIEMALTTLYAQQKSAELLPRSTMVSGRQT
jgi:hypothetical protein